ncbi:hypothetical protein SAMN05518845_12057 [Variovorax sp. YR750]|uniref:hypothetical protein n=1 Tax=Variovorax sp. YR750 TaxID=1884384 RepID=UPI0008D107E1|nr:hypothetical protein [Variovorax sp. YR750]MDP9602111.1 hypothetical protein [Variovorax paradoxus]SEM31165.1 hypothetical protein SAMN05518845_12057 [Variovorax sp. YR750]
MMLPQIRLPAASLTDVEAIQIAFPDAPEWSKVSLDTLLGLARGFDEEPSCAGSALTELAQRGSPEVTGLCRAILEAKSPDVWLHATALSLLLSADCMAGFDAAMHLVDDRSPVLLNEVIEALNYEHQGDLRNEVHRHPIVPLVQRCIAGFNNEELKFRDLFIANFGAGPLTP